MTATLITTVEELADLCQRLASAHYVTVDTEFMRESTFWPKLCLAQVAGPDDAVAIDALAPGMDLRPLFELMANENIVKVFHAARQDIEIFHHLDGRIPAPLFDSQVAAMVCGFGDSADIPHIPSKFVEIVPLSHRQGNCIPYAAIRWHDFGNRPALGRPLGHFSRHPDTPLLSLSPRRRFPRPTPERVFVADHQSSSGFSGTGPSAPPPQPIGT